MYAAYNIYENINENVSTKLFSRLRNFETTYYFSYGGFNSVFFVLENYANYSHKLFKFLFNK